MHVQKEIAPTYRQLRPLKPAVTSTFPVYKELPAALAEAKTHPDPVVAHMLATAAGYAYSTAFLMQSRDGRVAVLAYRGTEPINFINWLTDFDVDPDTVVFRLGEPPVPYAVHGGFYRNVRSTRYEIVAALQRALDGRSVLDEGVRMDFPLEALYITGHSLGGAMAAIMTLMLRTEPEYAPIAEVLRATYTFGAPMIGSPADATWCPTCRRGAPATSRTSARSTGTTARRGRARRHRPGRCSRWAGCSSRPATSWRGSIASCARCRSRTL